MWEITRIEENLDRADLLLAILDRLTGMPGVLRASLAGDHVRALTTREISGVDLAGYLGENGVRASVEPSQPEMEDVFLSLIGEDVPG
jgi:hypothetical protein